MLYFVSILTGCMSGIITGMIPGLHVNTISAILVSLASTVLFSGIDMQYIVIFIAAMAITHTFFDVFPTLFLGIPGDSVFSLLPGHKMVKNGRGAEALFLSIYGSMFGILLSVSLLLLFIFYAGNFIKELEQLVKQYMFPILLIVSIILIISDTNKVWGFIIFMLSGLFGIITMGSPLIPSGDQSPFSVLFPALTGLFGLSGLIQSLFEEEGQLPKQATFDSADINKRTIFQNSILGTIGGMVVGFLPGLGSANAATMLLLLQENLGKKTESKEENAQNYLVSTSALNTSDAIFAIVALYLINKSRSGASVAIQHLSGGLDQKLTLTIVISMLVASILSFFIIRYTHRSVIYIFSKLNYKALTLSVISFLILFIFQTTGYWGLIVSVSATFLGMIAPVVNARRAQAMGYFMIPVMLYYSGYQADIVSFLNLESKVNISDTPTLKEIMFFILSSMMISIILYFFVSKKMTLKQNCND